MGKITVNPGNLRKNQPGGEHITRIMYDNNEPPKNYIWGKPDGYLYQWNGIDWTLINGSLIDPPSNVHYITKFDLDLRLRTLKTEIISYINKLISVRDCNGNEEATINWINEHIVPDVRRLQEIDHDQFATKEELENAVSDIASSSAITDLTENISGLNSRIVNLENYDHSVFVTADDV